LPGHTSAPVSFDGVPLAASLAEVFSRLDGWFASEDEFVARILSRLPPTPPNYQQIVDLNERGTFPAADVIDLEAGANRCAIS
jgi:hypothetical protein